TFQLPQQVEVFCHNPFKAFGLVAQFLVIYPRALNDVTQLAVMVAVAMADSRCISSQCANPPYLLHDGGHEPQAKMQDFQQARAIRIGSSIGDGVAWMKYQC